MDECITLHASAYPPASWSFLSNREPQPRRISNNELWIEMTKHYEQSMAKRHRIITSNFLSETATDDNIGKMDDETAEKYRQRGSLAFKHEARDIGEILKERRRFTEAVNELSHYPMMTVPEEHEFGHSRWPNQIEYQQIKQAMNNTTRYEELRDNQKIKRSFKARLDEIYSANHEFICAPIDKHPRPRWAQIRQMDREVTTHVAHVQHQSTSDVIQLRGFLLDRLFDEYCLMRETPEEKKNKTWLKYGKCIVSGWENGKCEISLTKETAEFLDVGDREVRDRLDRMIDASGLNPKWVMNHIEDYYNGNDHIGRWQGLVQDRRWNKLAEKLHNDIQQLTNSFDTKDGRSRRQKIMVNIHNTKRQFFNRLDGALDFELNEKISKEEGYDRAIFQQAGWSFRLSIE